MKLVVDNTQIIAYNEFNKTKEELLKNTSLLGAEALAVA